MDADCSDLAAPQGSLLAKDNAEPVPAKQARKRAATSLPDGFAPNETARYLARSTGIDLEHEVPAFCDYHRSKGSTFSDWQAAFRTWIRNATKFAPKSGPRARASPADDALQRQADRVEMLRAQEAAEELRAAGGGT